MRAHTFASVCRQWRFYLRSVSSDTHFYVIAGIRTAIFPDALSQQRGKESVCERHAHKKTQTRIYEVYIYICEYVPWKLKACTRALRRCGVFASPH